MFKKSFKAQTGVEYLILAGFITFAILTILGMSYFYSGMIKDKIKINQIDNFATKIILSSESVFFAGEPSETTLVVYLPQGAKELTIEDNGIYITIKTSTGDNKLFFKSKVPLQGTISISEGVKKLSLKAQEEYVLIS